jgi:glycosyltransferase involved in cell wall biosynthesis
MPPGREPIGSRTIAIVTGAPLCRNPRVVKEAEGLCAAGYEVTVLGPSFTEALAEEDRALTSNASWRHLITADLRTSGPQRVTVQFVRRLGSEAVKWIGTQVPDALGYGVRRALEQARQIGADLYVGHQEVGLWVTDQLAREGRRVGADLEDWYSEDLLPEARAHRPIRLLRQLEANAVKRSGHVTTTSTAMAKALAQEYGGPQPAVVYNAFPWSDRSLLDGRMEDRITRTLPSLHWVSQTIGPGRGLEALFEALRVVPVPTEVHLRGACSPDEEARLRRLFPEAQGHRLFFHALVPHEKLLSRIAEHDIGLALEAAEPPSRYYTVTNKILHYLLGGLAVIATDTAGQREVASAAPQAVRLCRNGDASSLAAAINELLASPEALGQAKLAALNAARTRFCWEQQVPVLLASVEQALADEAETECVAS